MNWGVIPKIDELLSNYVPPLWTNWWMQNPEATVSFNIAVTRWKASWLILLPNIECAPQRGLQNEKTLWPKPWPYGGSVWVEEIALMGLFVAMDLDRNLPKSSPQFRIGGKWAAHSLSLRVQLRIQLNLANGEWIGRLFPLDINGERYRSILLYYEAKKSKIWNWWFTTEDLI